MATETRRAPGGPTGNDLASSSLTSSQGGLFGTIALSYIAAAFLLGWAVWAGGFWNLIANTRLLALFYRAGVIALTDADQGLVQGAPSPDYFLASQDAVDWILIPVAILLMLVMWNLRGFLFSGLARFAGAKGSVAQLTAAYLFGSGLNLILPYRLGDVATAATLEESGTPTSISAQATFLDQVFLVINVVVFAVIGMLTVGGTTGLTQLLWDEVILLIAYLIVRGTGMRTKRQTGPGWLRTAGSSLSTLAHYPGTFVRLIILSLLTFGLEILAAYVISQAFTGTFVILNVDFRVLMMGVIAGHIAALIPVTPGGIGQFEWGFAASLFIGGIGIPEAVTIAVLYNLLRYGTGLFLMWIARRTVVRTNTREVIGYIRSAAEVTP
jgi:uncharacterized membrane protein YbhN (UPF0104 family)